MATVEQMTHDPVLEALGMTSATADQDWMLNQYQQAALYDGTYVDPQAQLAWYQAQAMITTAWQLQQMATYTQAAAYAQACAAIPAATTPRGTAPAGASEATPTKTGALASDASTEPGSPSGDSQASDEDQPAHEPLQLQELLGAPPPPPPTPTKLDLHAIIFEKAKDPISANLLNLIKGSEDARQGQEKGKEILDLLREPRTGPIASGAHRRAAAAARKAAAAAAAVEEEEQVPRRRRPRGGRGARK
jgi:hypothetical protein